MGKLASGGRQAPNDALHREPHGPHSPEMFLTG